MFCTETHYEQSATKLSSTENLMLITLGDMGDSSLSVHFSLLWKLSLNFTF